MCDDVLKTIVDESLKILEAESDIAMDKYKIVKNDLASGHPKYWIEKLKSAKGCAEFQASHLRELIKEIQKYVK